MSISTGIPESWKLPLFWASVDGSQAGSLTENEPALLVGQFNSATGTATPNVPVPIGSVTLAKQLFGAGSMLARMATAFFQVNTNQLLYGIPVPDPSAGQKATGTITVSAAPTGSGTLSVYIAGQLVQIAVGSTDSTQTVAANLVAQINAQTDLPVTAAAGSGGSANVVTLTCGWKGLTGNDITIVPNYLGTNGGQAYPAGLALTIVAMNGGTGEPDFTAAISAIQAQEFDYVAMPCTDTGSLQAWATEYGFSVSGRWGYTRQQFGTIYNAFRDDYADLITWGLSQNAPVISTLAIEQQVPSPVWEVSAAYCGVAALGFSDDPARPLQTLELLGILPAPLQNRFTQSMLNNLCQAGLAVQGVDPSGNMMILRECMQYQLNSFGQADTAYNLATTLATLAELLRRMKSAITTKYPRVKLFPDGTALGPGQAAITPSIAKAELVSEFVQAEYDGLVSNSQAYISNLVVEIDDNNPDRLNVLWPPQLAGQLRQFAVLAQFRLLDPPIAV